MSAAIPERKERRLQMLVEPSLIGKIDKWRAQQPELPSRSEAIRRLIELGLKAAKNEQQMEAAK